MIVGKLCRYAVSTQLDNFVLFGLPLKPSCDLIVSVFLDKGHIGPDTRMVGGPQCRIGGTRGVETYAPGKDSQRSRQPDIIDAPIKPGPIGMGHATIRVLQGSKSGRGGLRRAKEAGHALCRGHLQGGIEIATYDPGRHTVTRLEPG